MASRQVRVVAPNAQAARRHAEQLYQGRANDVQPIRPATRDDLQLFWKSMPLQQRQRRKS